ncbi:hypothetical protein C8J56DRAFT_777029 [Mycena floridula]|nr:hypothetical protein C8J56DRAFT_777029 [Mycena floridula]
MVDFPITTAQLIGMFLECLFYGIYITTCFPCWMTLLTTGSRMKCLAELNLVMIAASTVFFMISTLDVSLGLYHNIKSFVLYSGPGCAAAELLNVSDWVNVVDTVIQAGVSDAVLIYRCFIVYNRSWKVIIPSLALLVGFLFCGISMVHLEAMLRENVPVNVRQIGSYAQASLGIMIMQNVVTTGLLVWKIWSVDKQSRQLELGTNSGNSPRHIGLRKVIQILMESGLLLTVCAIISFIAALCKSNADYPTTDSATVVIVGISFNLIIIRSTKNSCLDNQIETGTTIPLQQFSRPRAGMLDGSNKHQAVHVMVSHNTTYDPSEFIRPNQLEKD